MRRGWPLLALCACGRLDFAAREGADATAHVGFTYRKPIAISHTSAIGGVDLAGFPLALRITDADLRALAAGGKLVTGNDFAFVDADGTTPLAFEVDGPISASGDLLAWVKLPLLSATVDTELYLAFGDANVTASQASPASVWSDYVAVWHFSELAYTGAPGEVLDATGAHPGSATAGATTAADGPFGRAASFAGSCAQISIPQSAALQPASVTVSAWARETDLGTSTDRIATILEQDYWRAAGTGSQGYYLEIYRTVSQPVPTFYAADGPAYAHAFSTVNIPNATWYYQVGTYDASTGTSSIYSNGALQGTATMTGPIAYIDHPIGIGCGPSGWWAGELDEIRVSNVARSAAWIATEYANQLDPSGFATVGPTEPAP